MDNIPCEEDRTFTIPLLPPTAAPEIVFTDAEGYGGVGAVVLGTRLELPDALEGMVPEAFAASLRARKTQIIAFEQCVPAAAIWSWKSRLAGNRVIFYIDNSTALGILKSGKSKAADLNELSSRTREIFTSLG